MNPPTNEMVNELPPVNLMTTRPLVFINLSDPVNQKQMITHDVTSLTFRPPFPPVLEAEDIFGKKSNGTNPTKPPNAFILYRRAFVKIALANGYKLPMTVVSMMASQAWEQESSFVKNEYKKIAKEAKKNHELLFPKVTKKSDSKRWRVYPIKSRNKSTSEQTESLTVNEESLTISEPSTLTAPQIVIEDDGTSDEWEQLFNFHVDPNKEKNGEQDGFIWEDFLENYDNNDQVDYQSSVDNFQLPNLPSSELAIETPRDMFLNVKNNAQNFDLEPGMTLLAHLEQNQINESLNVFDSPIEPCQEVSSIPEPLEFIFSQKSDIFADFIDFEIPSKSLNYPIENPDEQILSFH